MNTDARLTAKLLSACPPDSAQKEKLEDVLSKKYGKVVELGDTEEIFTNPQSDAAKAIIAHHAGEETESEKGEVI